MKGYKMTATINDMELRFADLLYPNQLMENDIIKIDEEYFTVKVLSENNEGFNIVVADDYDELLDIFLFDDEKVELYVFVE
jgi:hypothetical protein